MLQCIRNQIWVLPVWEYYIRRAEEDPGLVALKISGDQQWFTLYTRFSILKLNFVSSFWKDSILILQHEICFDSNASPWNLVGILKDRPVWPGSGPEVFIKLYLDHSEHYPALVKPLPGDVPDLRLGIEFGVMVLEQKTLKFLLQHIL